LTDEVTPDEVDVVTFAVFLRNGRSFLAETDEVVKKTSKNTKIKIYEIFFVTIIS